MKKYSRAILIGTAAAALAGLRPAAAVVQGSESAESRAVALEHRGEYRQAAVWRRASLEMMERLSIPMFAEIRRQRAQLRYRPAETDAETLFRSQVEGPLARNRAALRADERRSARQAVPEAEMERVR